MSNFAIGQFEEPLCEIILNFGQQFRKRCCLLIFLCLALVAILFGSVELFKQFQKNILGGTFVICSNFFQIWASGLGVDGV